MRSFPPQDKIQKTAAGKKIGSEARIKIVPDDPDMSKRTMTPSTEMSLLSAKVLSRISGTTEKQTKNL